MKDVQWKWGKRYMYSNGGNCGSKKVFNSFTDAAIYNKQVRTHLKGSARREELHVYRCNSCRQWHIGHTPSRPGRYKEDYRG